MELICSMFESAVYGYDALMDVTYYIKAAIILRKPGIFVSNETFGNDPSPKVPKVCILNFVDDSHIVVKEDAWITFVYEDYVEKSYSFVERVFYINLDSCVERKESAERELLKVFPQTIIQRFPAIRHEKGYIGCAMSHLAALQLAKYQKLNNVLITEDDIGVNDTELVRKAFGRITTQKWNVIALGTTYTKYNDVSLKLYDGQTTTAYLVNSSYYDKLISCFSACVSLLLAGKPKGEFAIDIYWKQLQRVDNWFVCLPCLIYQKSVMSEIEHRMVNYSNLFERELVITPKLIGGLGNRLFQLAAAMGVGSKHYKRVVLSKAHITVNPHQTTDDAHFFRNINRCDHILNYYQSNETLYNTHDVVDDRFKNCLMIGYRQNEQYFSHIKQYVCEQFSAPPDVVDELYAKYPNLQHAAFYHIRRGDYLKLSPVYGIDLENYYAQSAKLFNANVVFFVCSDDLAWCRENIKTNHPMEFIDENEVMTLWVMSLCKQGGICANSTLSWWGAYLNQSERAQFCYPSVTLKNSHPYPTGYIPDKFTIIDV